MIPSYVVLFLLFLILIALVAGTHRMYKSIRAGTFLYDPSPRMRFRKRAFAVWLLITVSYFIYMTVDYMATGRSMSSHDSYALAGYTFSAAFFLGVLLLILLFSAFITDKPHDPEVS